MSAEFMMKVTEKLYFRAPAVLQNLMISGYGRLLYQKRYTGLYHKIRTELENVKALSAPEVMALQEENLHQMVNYCATQIPYYQKLFAEHGLRPGDITALQDLKKLPTLNKQTILEQNHNFRAKDAKNPL